MSVVIHEVAHGYAAYAQGDITAAVSGRLTLNPVKHVDPVGSILVPGILLLMGAPFLIGWAKPVPFNPYNLRDQKWGHMWVALAGPASNILLAVVFALGLRFVPMLNENAVGLIGFVVLINLVLALFNLVPIPPLDGSKVLFALLPVRMRHVERTMERFGLLFAIFFIFLLWEPFTYIVLGTFVILVGPGANMVLVLTSSLL